jgi:hypothetical protein
VKLRIKDTVYDQMAAREDGRIGLLRDMKRYTGLGRQSLERQLMKLGTEVKTGEQLFDDPDLLHAILTLAWLCKRHAGEQFTFEDAEALEYTDIVFVGDDGLPLQPEDSDGVEPPLDPTQPPVAATARRKNGSAGKSSKPATLRITSAAS